MKSLTASFIIGLFILLLSSSNANASLLVVKKDGEVTWNVLSEEDTALGIPTHSYLEVKKAGEVTPSSTSVITLSKKNDKISLFVDSGNEKRELDVTNWQEDLLEIEERAEVQKLKINLNEGTIDSKSAELSLVTPSGERFVSIFPLEAVEAVLRTKLITKAVNPKIEIVEKERELQYIISGEKVFNILGIYEYSIPITSYISASTGEILSVDSPTWFKYVKFLFV